MHAYRVAARARRAALIVPVRRRRDDALGFLAAPLAFDFVRSFAGRAGRRSTGSGSTRCSPRWRQRAPTCSASGVARPTIDPRARRRDALRRAGPRGARAAAAGTLDPGQRARCAGVRDRVRAPLRPARSAGVRWRRSPGGSFGRPAARLRRSTRRRATAPRRARATRAGLLPEQDGMADDAGLRPLPAGPGAPFDGPGDRRGARVDARHRPAAARGVVDERWNLHRGRRSRSMDVTLDRSRSRCSGTGCSRSPTSSRRR